MGKPYLGERRGINKVAAQKSSSREQAMTVQLVQAHSLLSIPINPEILFVDFCCSLHYDDIFSFAFMNLTQSRPELLKRYSINTYQQTNNPRIGP